MKGHQRLCFLVLSVHWSTGPVKVHLLSIIMFNQKCNSIYALISFTFMHSKQREDVVSI